MKPNRTDYTIEKYLLKTAIVLVDTREQENQHIIDYLDKIKVAYKVQKLKYGDYTLLVPENQEFGITCDMILDFAVERKASLNELSGNFTNDRTRIEEEFWRGKDNMALVVENGSFDKILSHEYRTQYNEKAFVATIISFWHRYGVPPMFVSKENSGKIILAILKYKLREELKK
jgi:ERCC4-type nuclease